jgi:hypothetical protein
MVPGSTFKYPSSLIGVILYFSDKKKPAEAVVTHFPIPERTHPVTTIYFLFIVL